MYRFKYVMPTLHFLVIGAHKSGTTWLFQHLRLHRQISFPGGKEVHFWDLYRSRGLTWYFELFANDDGTLHGDITPAYAALPAEVVRECHQLFPDTRLIFSMRNPIDRAWSSAKMKAVALGMNVMDVPDEWFIGHFHSAPSMAKGDHENCIRNWLKCYQAEQLLLLRFEEIAADPGAYINRCLMHLGLEPVLSTSTAHALANPLASVALRQKIFEGDPAPLRSSLRPILEDLYRPRIASLASYLGQDFDEWLR